MKKVLSFVLAAVMILSLCACGSTAAPAAPAAPAATEAPAPAATPEPTPEPTEEPAPEPETVRLATLQGPTGMGMAYLLDDADNGVSLNNYEYTVCAGPDEITGKIVSGELDIAALPTNAAATLYNKSNGKVLLLALNTDCVLYILEKGDSINSVEDLAGKTIYVSGQGSTPEFILNHVLDTAGIKDDVTIDFTYTTHNDLVAFAATGGADVVLLPEPAVTALLSKSEDFRVALSVEDLWDGEGIAMGCVVVNAAFAEEHPNAVSNFLKEYEASISKVTDESNRDDAAAVIAKVGIVAAEGVAKKALPRCAITFVSGEAMKDKLESFFSVLFEAQPNSVGGALPDDNFYYIEK